MPRGIRKERKPLKPGMVFERNFKGTIYKLQVIEKDGKINFSLDGEVFNSPTAAAQALIKNKYATNGWVFWGMKNY